MSFPLINALCSAGYRHALEAFKLLAHSWLYNQNHLTSNSCDVGGQTELIRLVVLVDVTARPTNETLQIMANLFKVYVIKSPPFVCQNALFELRSILYGTSRFLLNLGGFA